MNQDANQNASNAPVSAPHPDPNVNGSAHGQGFTAKAAVAPVGTTPPAKNGGLASSLRVAVPLVALVGVVFGVTYITMYTPPKEDTPKGTSTKGGEPTNSPTGEPPLVFFSSTRGWDPPLLVGADRHMPLLAKTAAEPEGSDSGRVFPFSLQNRIFQGFYETDLQTLRRTQFWFENRNPQSVTMQLKGVSCTACTGGRLAAIPPEVTKSLFQHTALSALPMGPFNSLGIGLVQPAASLSQLQWTEYQFKDNPHATYQIPGATSSDKWAPQWGILELTFRVTGERKDPLRAGFLTRVDGTEQVGANEFAIMFHVSPACVLSRSTIDVGKLDILSGDREYEFYVYSSTRGPSSEFGDLEPPSCIVQTPPGVISTTEFVTVSKPERVPETRLVDIENELKTRVRTAYKMKVTVHPKVGETRMDIGLFERFLSVTAGSVTQQIVIRAMVSGPVWLENDRTEIDLGSFQGNEGWSSSVNLITEKPDAELVVVKEESRPANFTYTLQKQMTRGGRGHYILTIKIPSGQFGKVRGEVMLEVKGPNPQRMRIPVTGSGRF